MPVINWGLKMNEGYNIVRFYRVSGRQKIIHRNVTLQVAQLHCNDPRTSKENVWFDGYRKVT